MILDSETATFFEIARRTAPEVFLRQTGLATIGTDVPLRPQIEQWLRGRIEWVQAGIDKCPKWFKNQLEEFDKDLRIRWDSYKHHWVIEHYSQHTHLYHRCGTWDKPLSRHLINELRRGDMTRTSTAEKIRDAEERAETQRKKNDQAAVEGYIAQFDNLSRRAQEDFVEISRAIEHGEKVSFMGKDADFMNKIYEDSKKRPELVLPEKAINPGMKPGRRKGK